MWQCWTNGEDVLDEVMLEMQIMRRSPSRCAQTRLICDLGLYD